MPGEQDANAEMPAGKLWVVSVENVSEFFINQACNTFVYLGIAVLIRIIAECILKIMSQVKGKDYFVLTTNVDNQFWMTGRETAGYLRSWCPGVRFV